MATPFERVRAAWDSDDRLTALNRAVEAMAEEGVSRVALEDALGLLLDEARAAGVDDDTEEIINGVGDRLAGWCHERWHIKTKPPAGPAGNGVATPPADRPVPAGQPSSPVS